MKEAIKQAGTLAELEAMNPIERDALAKAIGVSNDKLRQMIANEKEALKPVDGMTSSFNTMSATVDHIGTTGVGKWLGGFTGLLGTVGKIGMGLKQIGIDTGAFMKKAIWDKVPFLNTTDSVSDKAKPKRGRGRPKKSGAGLIPDWGKAIGTIGEIVKQPAVRDVAKDLAKKGVDKLLGNGRKPRGRKPK